MNICAGCGCALHGEGKFKPYDLDGSPMCLPCLSEQLAALDKPPLQSNVVSILKARPVTGQQDSRKMWVCGECGGQWFWLYAGGDIQCASCDADQSTTIRTFLQ